MESKLTPILRFREYEHEWKAKTFKELGSVAMCKRIFKEQTTAQGEIPFYKIGTFGKIADSYISRETYEEYKEKYIYPKVGDILLSASGTIGRTVIYDGEDAYFQDSNIIWFNAHKEPLDNSFLYQFYQVVKWSGLEGSTIKRLYNENVLSTNINLPSLEEQKKIGSFFKSLDDTISLHQQELEALKQTKQGFLQKMFPKKGQLIPEIRLSGYKENWKEMKFKNLAKIRRGLTYKPKDVDKTGVRVLRSSNIKGDSFILKNDDVFVKQEAVNIDYAKENEILITSANGSSNLVGKHALIKKLDQPTVHGGFMLIASAKTPYFVNTLMSTEWYDRFIKVHVSGGNGAIGNLNKNNLENYSVMVPSIEEQIKIGDFFRQLDEVIELKEKEVEALKETKKGFLQKMFI